MTNEQRSVTVHAAIGNSDDKLSQLNWSGYIGHFTEVMTDPASTVHGVWHSAPDSAYQNCCMAIEIDPEALAKLRTTLIRLRTLYRQDSIAFSVSETELI